MKVGQFILHIVLAIVFLILSGVFIALGADTPNVITAAWGAVIVLAVGFYWGWTAHGYYVSDVPESEDDP